MDGDGDGDAKEVSEVRCVLWLWLVGSFVEWCSGMLGGQFRLFSAKVEILY